MKPAYRLKKAGVEIQGGLPCEVLYKLLGFGESVTNLTPTREKPDFVPATALNRDVQTRAHLCLTAADKRERARLRRKLNLEDSVHKCARELRLFSGDDTLHACPTCGTIIKTLDDWTRGG